MKHLKITIVFLFIVLIFQSCDLLDRNLKDRHIEQQGYITDTLGVGIENVKITVLKAEDHSAEKEETDMVYYTDSKGYYKINIDNEGYIYYMKMTHNEYIYVVKPGNFAYPQIAHFQSDDEERNYEMVKLGKVKIKGNAKCSDGNPFWLENVKITVLKRQIGNEDYPVETGIETYTSAEGKYYIEYEGDKNYEFFLKPEKEGYFYLLNGEFDYKDYPSTDPGYVISGGFSLEKENK